MLKRLSFTSRIWLGLFALWVVFLSGVLSSWVGSPGAWQAYRLHSLLRDREDRRIALQQEIAKIQTEYGALEKSRAIQLREIRHVLGYVAPGEMIFDFTSDARE